MKDLRQRGWTEVSLGDVCEKMETVDPRRTPDCEFQYVDVSSVSNETFTIEQTQRLRGSDAPSRARRKIRSGDILFATIRPTLQRIAQIPESLDDQVCSTGYIVLRPKPDLDARFLMHSLFRTDFMDAMEVLQSGTSYPAVTDKQIRTQKIPLPPLEEQERIVAVLDEAFEGLAHARAHTEANLQNARDLRQSFLEQAFQGRLGGDAAKAGWEEQTLGDVCDIYQPKTISAKQMVPDGPYPVFGANGVIGRYTEYNHEEPQLLVTCRGATCGSVNISDPFSWITGNAMVIRPKVTDLSLRYVEYFFRGAVDLDGVITGAAQPQITRKSLAPVRIEYPPPEEQQRIVAVLDKIFEHLSYTMRVYQDKIKDLDNFRQSLLQKAFAGELT